MTKEQFEGYLKGSVMKYVWREKENKKEDLEKAKWFINKLQEQLRKKPNNSLKKIK